jgi:PTS system maltose and glucose-specific IIC component
MNKFFEKAQQVGKSFMLPIAILPAAGLLLGIGGALSNPNTLVAYPLLNIQWLQVIFAIMSAAGTIVFANLPVLFAVGVTVGLVKSDKGTAGLAALLGYLVMNATIQAILGVTGNLAEQDLSAVGQGMTLGIQTLESGVFGGLVVAILAAILHTKYNKITAVSWFFRWLTICSNSNSVCSNYFRRSDVFCLASFPKWNYANRPIC